MSANPLQHRKTNWLRHRITIWRFNNRALAAQRRRDQEIQSLIKAGRKAAKKATKELT